MWFSYPWIQPAYFRQSTCLGKFPSSRKGCGKPQWGTGSSKQPSGELPLSTVAVFLPERSTAEVLGTQTELQPQQRLQHKFRRELEEPWTQCCRPGVGHGCLLKCGFLFSSTPLAWQWVCDPFTSVAMKTTVSWPSPECYCRRKLFVPVYSLTKGSQTQSDPPVLFLFPYHLPRFVKKVGPKHAWDTCKEWHARSARGGAASACLCVYMCGSAWAVCVWHTKHTHTDPRTL